MHPPRRSLRQHGFTIVEMLVAMTILTLIIIVLMNITSQTSATWRYTTGKIEEFREARNAFETITTRLGQATLNTYWDYDNPSAPTRYERRSELRFIAGKAVNDDNLLGDQGTAKRLSHCVFFHAPLGFSATANYQGLENLLNVWGYYVEFNNDSLLRPRILNSVFPPIAPRYRFRLMELMQPAEQMRTYGIFSGNPTTESVQWFTSVVNTSSSSKPVHVLADNIIALIIRPSLSKQDQEDYLKTHPGAPDAMLAPYYTYDSNNKHPTDLSKRRSNIPELNPTNQLPPVVSVTMVAIDEQSAVRLRMTAGSTNVFGVLDKFVAAADYDKDLLIDITRGADDSLENKLASLRVNYRVFTTNVPIRAAKWSREQKDSPKP